VDWYDNGVSAYGVYDLCGNVWEWCASAGLRGQMQIRGGAFTAAGVRAIASTWSEAAPEIRRDDLGFRTVLTLEAMLELLSI
jgi:formylglycine-generating enzyme required for sulfatase activity